MTSVYSPWDKTKANMKGNNKSKRRRIDFMKSDAETSFSASSKTKAKGGDKPAGKQNFGSNGKITPKDKKSDVKDEISGPTPGLFPPDRVAQNMAWHKMTRIGAGFYNHGNTCFLNATLQCLYHIPALTQIIARDKDILLKGGQSKQKTVFEHYIR
jgi:hypothetical protein